MRHRCAYRKLGRDTAGRRQLFQNQITSLILNGRIISTLPKVKELRRVVERTITKAKNGSQQGLLKLSSFLKKEDVLTTLYGTLVNRYRNRTGGFTRVMRIGYRERDKAPLGLIELVDSPFEYKKALSLFEKLKGERDEPFCYHPPISQLSNTKRAKMAQRGLLPKTHNCYDYPPVARQYLINHLHLYDESLVEMKKKREAYFEGKLLEIYRRERQPKYRPGWSLPLDRPSFLESVLTLTPALVSKVRPKMNN